MMLFVKNCRLEEIMLYDCATKLDRCYLLKIFVKFLSSLVKRENEKGVDKFLIIIILKIVNKSFFLYSFGGTLNEAMINN